MNNQERKRVFISYGHKDGFDFVRRLAFSLEMYVDVFWDKRLGIGKFDDQLYTEIEKCDFLIILMTPYALREDGWCRKELKYAEKHNKPIVPIKLHDDCGFDDIETWISITTKDQYADFMENFDAGFQRLTQMLLGQPYLSWESFALLNDRDLRMQLSKKRLPKLIEEEIAEWTVVHKAWKLAIYIISQSNPNISIGLPTTISGVNRCCKILLAYASKLSDSSIAAYALDIEKIIKAYSEYIYNQEANSNYTTLTLIEEIYELNILKTSGRLDAEKLREIKSFFYFDVAEKLRELINVHARRSRYLY